MNSSRLLWALAILLGACNSKSPLFRNVPATESGISFANIIPDDEVLNVLHYEYVYNGGGVAIGDFNNDSLPDIYFTGNRVPNKLYINRGHLHFEDVSQQAGVEAREKWSKGVSLVDINNDGLLDIYVSAAVLLPVDDRKNMLYVNQGADAKTGIPVFKDMAAEYGLDDNSSTHMTAFFDYDNDGDLDAYLLVNELDGTYPNEFRPIRKDGSWPNTDKLLRNDWNPSLRHGVFKDVSREAGILIEGYGLGLNILDINDDGWKDIYVSNDYLSNNHLYINNHDGTFTDKVSQYFKHNSKNAMGNDVADINNDGLPDIIELDMAPQTNVRQKMILNDTKYQTFQNSAWYGYMIQYPRNTLQLNQGRRMMENGVVGEPVFSDIAFYAGVAQTDWSWAPLLIDVDHDGFRDLMITNGLPRDMSDQDYISYREEAKAKTPITEMLKRLPSAKIPNFIFKNNGDLTFTDMSTTWGWTEPTFSAGMAYADLDRDGDVDVVINNTNMVASLLENKLNESTEAHHALRIKLQGDSLNRDALGARVDIFYSGTHQVYDYTPYRGYMSTVEQVAHFGTGTSSRVDSVVITWPDATEQKLTNLSCDRPITICKTKSTTRKNFQKSIGPLLLTDETKAHSLSFLPDEYDFIDFNIQRLIPHKLSESGPALASADVNGDGLDDVLVGGGAPRSAALFIQQPDGKFLRQKFIDTLTDKAIDDASICFFDADGDGDADVYVAGGGAEVMPGPNAYVDHLYVNDGHGGFTEQTNALPRNGTAKSSVKAADIDHDGDLDLFVGGRSMPGYYPSPVSSVIYRNDSRDGKIVFTNATSTIAPRLTNIGMVTDATWTDVDNDGWVDLVVVGEWMPIHVFKNAKGLLTGEPMVVGESGWWNSITTGDLDNDGDIDWVVGNYGNNGFLKPTQQHPIHVWAKDFDGNGSFDPVLSVWQPTSLTNAQVQEFPLATRDEFISQLNVFRTRYPNYSTYANTGIKNLLTDAERKDALTLQVTSFTSVWVENKEGKSFVVHPLPTMAQLAPMFGALVDDLDEDGNLDIAWVGNDFSMSPMLGRYDASNGVVLKGDGKGAFVPLPMTSSGFYVPGNGKSILRLNDGTQNRAYVIGQNGSRLKWVKSVHPCPLIHVQQNDVWAWKYLRNGRKRKEEFQFGSTFGSQSSHVISMESGVSKIEIVNQLGQTRIVQR